jgi:voltage-gated sodium channel
MKTRLTDFLETTLDAMEHQRARLRGFLTSRRFETFITAVIIINAITLGLETSQWVMDRVGGFLLVFDKIVLGIFVVEILAKLFAFGFAFFRSGWNWFDAAIVGISLMPASGALSVMRALRILRVLRLISVVPALRRVVGALVTALPGMASIIVLMGLVFYIFSVMATKLFGATFPQWFGTIGESFYSLFQIMTLESWSMGIVRPVMEAYPYAWAFFVPFILSTSFVVLNLFIGIVVSAMQAQHDAEANEGRAALADQNDEILTELRALRAELAVTREQVAEVREDGKV